MLQPGHDVLIDDGLVRLRVEEVDGGRARCLVVVGGAGQLEQGREPPGRAAPDPVADREGPDDLELALALGVDYVALSFVRAAADVRELQRSSRERGSTARVIAKIEKAEAIAALDEVLEATDAVMVARGDLGVEIGAAAVPLLQKQIILRCLEAREAGDHRHADARVDGRARRADPRRGERRRQRGARRHLGDDALRRDGRRRVSGRGGADDGHDRRAVEPASEYRYELPGARGKADDRPAMSNAATDIAETLDAKAILAATSTGRTASEIARLRPRRPMIGLSHHQ